MLTQNEIKETLEKFLVFKEKNLVAIYKSYASLYRSKDSYTSDHNKIKEINSLIDYSMFNKKIIQYLKKIDIFSYFGQEGLITFGDIIGKSPDINSTANAIDNFIKELDERIRRIDSILETINVLEPSKEEKYTLESNEALLSIHFQNQCNITGLEELSTQSKTWNNLIRQFHILNGITPDSNIKFQEIAKGSLIVTLGFSIYIIKNLGKLISWSLEQKKMWLEIKVLEKQLDDPEISSDEENLLKKFIDSKINKMEDAIITNIIEKMKTEDFKINYDLLSGSLEKTLKEIIKPIIEFYDKGGELLVHTSKTTDEDNETEKIFYSVNSQLKRLNSSTPNEKQDLLDD